MLSGWGVWPAPRPAGNAVRETRRTARVAPIAIKRIAAIHQDGCDRETAERFHQRLARLETRATLVGVAFDRSSIAGRCEAIVNGCLQRECP